jgi:glycosyltransferase involved in cell wall biosynthesis
LKILLHHLVPFSFAHGGQQIQIEQTKYALEQLGLEVEFLQWWDDSQTGELLHSFCRIPLPLLRMAQAKGIKVVVADLLTEQGSRSASRLRMQKLVSQILTGVLPRSLAESFNWDSYRLADACVALTSHEAQLMNYLFHVPQEKLHVVPNGVEDIFLQSKAVPRGPWLVCTATIAERKRIIELAAAAVKAQTPLWIVGKAYTDSDPYAVSFFQLAKQHPKIIRFEGPINDRSQMARTYREARGFILLSAMESLSLSALEAAACECPLLLSDLPWARTVFKESVSYCPVTPDTEQTAAALRRFYDAAPSLAPPARPLTWIDVARQLKTIYESLLKTSR